MSFQDGFLIFANLFSEPAQVIDPPKKENITYAAEIKIAKKKENDQVTDESAASHPRETVVAEEPISSAYPEDFPKISNASIVGAQTKKGPTKVYTPPAARVASTNTEKQSSIPVAEASVSEASKNRATVNAPETDYAHDEGILSFLVVFYLFWWYFTTFNRKT